MLGFEVSAELARPVDAVFAVLSDLARDADWRAEWVASVKTSDGPIGVGSTFRLQGGPRFWPIVAVYQVSAWEPDRSVSWTTVSGPLPLVFHRSFAPIDGGTRVTFRYEAAPGASGLITWFPGPISRAGKNALDGDLPTLRALLESTAS